MEDVLVKYAQVIVGICAFTALLMAIASERRARVHLYASLKPYLYIHASRFMHYKAVTLSNFGQGAALIQDVNLKRGANSVRNLADLFKFDQGIVWVNYWTFEQGIRPLAPGDSIKLVEISEKTLKDFEETKDCATEVLKNWENQLTEMEVDIVYTDIRGKQRARCYRQFAKT